MLERRGLEEGRGARGAVHLVDHLDGGFPGVRLGAPQARA